MTQNSSHICPNCGSAVAAGQYFCSNCGAIQDVSGNKLTELTPNSGGIQAPDMMTQRSVSPPPPPPPMYGAAPATPFEQGYQQQAQGYMPPPVYQPAPDFAKPTKGSSRRVWRQLGLGVGIVILVIVLACGVLGYFVYNGLHNAAKTLSSTSSTTGGTTSNTSGAVNSNQPTTQAGVTTSAINATVTYASVGITIIDVKQSTLFSDDNSSSKDGTVRLDIKEQTPSGPTGNYAYSEVARLQLPDGTIVQPLNEQNGTAPASGVARANWIDFPVPSTIKVDQLTLLLGTNTETQIKIPLNGKADLTPYQDKTSTPNKQTTYNGLKWTITNVMLSLSNSGTQAPKGMAFVTVTLKVDNPTSATFRGYYGDYIRLKAGDTTSAPSSDSTLPLGFDAGSSGQTGTVIFQVPQHVTAYTLILLGNSSLNVSQASIDFQI